MVNLILISMTLGRNWKIFFLIFSRFCSFSLSQYPFHPSVSLLAEDRAPCLHAVGLLGHVGTSLTFSLPPTENMRFVPAVAVGTVSPVPPWTVPPQPPATPRGSCLADVNAHFGKSRGKRRKKKPQSLKQSSKESASGEVIQSQFWISYTVNLFLLLWLYWMWDLLASTSSTVEGGISNEQTYKRVTEGTKGLSGLALGQQQDGLRLELRVCLNVPFLLVPLLPFLPGWKVEKRMLLPRR